MFIVVPVPSLDMMGVLSTCDVDGMAGVRHCRDHRLRCPFHVDPVALIGVSQPIARAPALFSECESAAHSAPSASSSFARVGST